MKGEVTSREEEEDPCRIPTRKFGRKKKKGKRTGVTLFK